MEILKRRKPRLYQKKNKNVVGLDIKFHEPKNNNFVIINATSLKELNKNADYFIKANKL